MDKIIQFPSAKNDVYINKYKINEETIEHVWDHALQKMSPKQARILKRRIAIADEILKHLPKDKQKLLDEYNSLANSDVLIIVDQAIRYAIEHEADLLEIMAE